jgi:protein phosphatase 2C family protein 2/3
LLIVIAAESRGPGNRQQYDDSGEDYDFDQDPRSRGGIAGRTGRIILLGDGTEVLTDSDEQEMFDQEEEDKDMASQVGRGVPSGIARSGREGTPGPEPAPNTTAATNDSNTESPSSATAKQSQTNEAIRTGITVVGALPEKLGTPNKQKD